MKRPFVFYPAIDYQSLYQRPQHIASRLVKRGHDVYFRNVGQVGGREPIIIDGVNIYQDWDRRPLEIDDKSIYIVNYPSFMGFRNWDDSTFVIYDCVDDFPDFEPYQKQACESANLILHTTSGIKDDIDKLINDEKKEYFKLPNGCDSMFFDNTIVAKQMKDLKVKYEKVLLFSGAMYFSWVDVEMMYNIARHNPKWAVVIIGDTYTWDFNVTNAPNNILRFGRKEYSELYTYYNGADIGLIPFLDNQISQGADPIKLYEYSACGIPVISKNLSFSTNIPEPICYNYNTTEECISQINKAFLENNADSVSKRKDFAFENTWENRVDQLLTKLSTLTELEI